MPVAVRVVHLDHHAGELAAAPVAPEHADRVEAVAERPRVGGHQDAATVGLDAVEGEEVLDVRLDRRVRVTEVVAGLEPAENPVVGQVVEVDQPGPRLGARTCASNGLRRVCRIVVAYDVGSSGCREGVSPHSTPSLRGRLDARAGAVLVESPAVPGAGEHDPVGVALGQAALGRHGGRRVDRVLVLHRLDDRTLVDDVLAAEGDDEAPAVRGHRQPHEPGHVVADGHSAAVVRRPAQVVPRRPGALRSAAGRWCRCAAGRCSTRTASPRAPRAGSWSGRPAPRAPARVGGHDDRVEGLDLAVAVGDLDAGRASRAPRSPWCRCGRRGWRGDLGDVLPRAAGDGAPLR